MVKSVEENRQQLNWSDLPDGFQNLLKRSYAEYKEILYDPYLHPRARKVPSWAEWLNKHDIKPDETSSVNEDTLLGPSAWRWFYPKWGWNFVNFRRYWYFFCAANAMQLRRAL